MANIQVQQIYYICYDWYIRVYLNPGHAGSYLWTLSVAAIAGYYICLPVEQSLCIAQNTLCRKETRQ